MQMPYDMTTLSQTMNILLNKGISIEFKSTPMGFTYDDIRYFKPQDLCIIKTYRFESMSDPSDTSILFVIKIVQEDFIGYCLDAFGVYSNQDINFHSFMRQVPICRDTSFES